MSEEIKEIKNEDLNEKENTNLDENKEVVIDKLPDENKASDEKQKKEEIYYIWIYNYTNTCIFYNL